MIVVLVKFVAKGKPQGTYLHHTYISTSLSFILIFFFAEFFFLLEAFIESSDLVHYCPLLSLLRQSLQGQSFIVYSAIIKQCPSRENGKSWSFLIKISQFYSVFHVAVTQVKEEQCLFKSDFISQPHALREEKQETMLF